MASQSRQKPERSNARVVGTVLLWIVLALSQGCRGIGDLPSNFKPDFELNITPDSVSVSSGATTSNVTLATTSIDDLTGPVNLTISGLPTGTTSSPPFPLSIQVGQSQNVTFTVPASASLGDSTVTITATSPIQSHSVTLKLTVTAGPDFALSLSPSQVSGTIGNDSEMFTVGVTGLNGFAGAVSISVSGLPSGAATQPASPFSVDTAATQDVMISLPANSQVGSFTLQVQGSNGVANHNVALSLTVLPVIKTYDTGSMLYLETDTSTETTKVGLRKAWGDSIVEVSLNGTNYVNSDDPGRQIQTSLWDGNANYNTSWGYNPIEAGDHFNDGSPVLMATLNPDSLYTKTQPIQWAPENLGGGPGNPVLGDAYIEKSISVVPGFNKAFKIHYKITHFGTDSHAVAPQELPVMYVNPVVPNFFYYAGNAPWTNDALSQLTMPGSCCTYFYTPESWGAYVDNSNNGIGLFTPGQFPDGKGFNAGSTLQFTPTSPYSWEPNSALEFNTYILVGSLTEIRAAVNALHALETGPTPFTPLGYFSATASEPLAGTASPLQGWAWSPAGITSLDVFVDGNKVGSASYHLSDPGVATAFPGAPADVGFQYLLDTTKLTNGAHAVIVKATDTNGKVATMATAQISVSN
jgi:hypothetical protein